MKKTLTTLTLALLAGTSFGFAEITTFEEAATREFDTFGQKKII